MAQTKKELVRAAFNNEPADRVPVGFWLHYTDPSEHNNGLSDPTLFDRNIAGHKNYYKKFGPDFIKIMSDGFFAYPSEKLANAKAAADLKGIEPLGGEHPWIVRQVDLAKALVKEFGSEVLLFYNIFAPLTYFRFLRERFLKEKDVQKLIAGFIAEDADAFKAALDVIGEDLSVLVTKIIREAKADGIYLSVQCTQDASVTREIYDEVVAPSQLAVLKAANDAGGENILHICGYEGLRNHLEWFTSYPAKAINWAVNVEGVSLAAGKALFGGRAVIGGFDNTAGGILYKGTKAEIEAFTDGLIRGAGTRGVIIGADCTLPNDTDLERFNWVRAKAAQVSAGHKE